MIGALGWLPLIPLSTQSEAAPLAGLVHTANPVIWEQVGVIPFALGALMFYRSRLVPRWLSKWGLVGSVLYIVPAIGSMFGPSLGVLMAPLALQETVMAVWLITRGFSPSAMGAEPAGETSKWQAVVPSTVPAS